jgi:hypothetical protein
MNTKKAAAIKHFTICSMHLPQVSPTEVLDWMKILSKSMVCWRHVSKLYKWETIQGPWLNLVSAPYWLTRVFVFTQWLVYLEIWYNLAGRKIWNMSRVFSRTCSYLFLTENALIMTRISNFHFWNSNHPHLLWGVEKTYIPQHDGPNDFFSAWWCGQGALIAPISMTKP